MSKKSKLLRENHKDSGFFQLNEPIVVSFFVFQKFKANGLFVLIFSKNNGIVRFEKQLTTLRPTNKIERSPEI